MDKSKSEKLKEILNQTLSPKEIEEKLKKEIENSAKKKIEEQKENRKKEEEQEEILKAKRIQNAIENLETQTEKEELNNHEFIKKDLSQEHLDEEVVIPSVREKKKEQQNINLLLYLIIIIAVLLLAIAIYLYTNKKSPVLTENKILKEQLVEDKEDEKKIDLKTIDKEDKKEKLLVSEPIKKEAIKSKPLKKKEVLIKEEAVKKEVLPVDQKPKEIIKIKEVIKEKIVTKIVKLDKKNFKEYYNSSKYKTLKCYNFKEGDVFPDIQCKTDLKKFLKDNKDALRFEVIPVIAENDNKVFLKMQSNIQNMNKDFQEKVKEYMFKGLSRDRVLETSWYIKDTLGEDTILTPTNYYVKSKKENKGIIIKAYH